MEALYMLKKLTLATIILFPSFMQSMEIEDLLNPMNTGESFSSIGEKRIDIPAPTKQPAAKKSSFKFACDEPDCEYNTNYKPHLNRHLRIHTGIKLYACNHPDCPYASSNSSNLNRHKKTHNKSSTPPEKRFKCNFCDFRASQNSNLKSHERIHTGERPFRCTICDDRFKQQPHLTVHMIKHTGKKKYACPNCPYRTAYKKVLQTHIDMHKGIKRFGCLYCNHRTRQRSHLREHIAALHPKVLISMGQ